MNKSTDETFSREVSHWELLADFRPDIMLWVLIGMLAWLLYSFPAMAVSFKEIFMGMKVQLPTTTEWVLRTVDFCEAWWPAYHAMALAAFTAWLSFPFLLVAGARNHRRGGPAMYARLQVSVTLTLSFMFAGAGITLLVLVKAIWGPMFNLVNATP